MEREAWRDTGHIAGQIKGCELVVAVCQAIHTVPAFVCVCVCVYGRASTYICTCAQTCVNLRDAPERSVCVCVHDNTHALLRIFSQMGCYKHTAELIHINEPNLYNENLMPTICDWAPSVYQRAQLVEELVCFECVYSDG